MTSIASQPIDAISADETARIEAGARSFMRPLGAVPVLPVAPITPDLTARILAEHDAAERRLLGEARVSPAVRERTTVQAVQQLVDALEADPARAALRILSLEYDVETLKRELSETREWLGNLSGRSAL